MLNAERVKLQCPEVNFICRRDGEQLILDLLERLDDPAEVAGPDLSQGRPADSQSKSAVGS